MAKITVEHHHDETLLVVTTPGHATAFRALAEVPQPACNMHALLKCPKRHGANCTSSKPCVNKGEQA